MLKDEVLISIIIPVYNVEKYLSKCIDSVLAQTEQRFEVILVNDGSKDESGNICTQYMEKDARVRALFQENKGVSAARNYGLKVARGKYVVFIDSDDWVEKDYLKILLKNMEDGGLSICGYKINDEIESSVLKTTILTKLEAQISAFSSLGIQGYPFSKMFDRDLIIEKGLLFDEDIAICEDLLFVIKYLEEVYSNITYENMPLYHYRVLNTGAVNKRFYKSNNFNLKMLTEYEALLRCEGHLLSSPKVINAHCFRMVKAAVATLRTMCANDYINQQLYRTLITYIRKNLLIYLFSSSNRKSSKISVFISALSPRLELLIWRKYNDYI